MKNTMKRLKIGMIIYGWFLDIWIQMQKRISKISRNPKHENSALKTALKIKRNPS